MNTVELRIKEARRSQTCSGLSLTPTAHLHVHFDTLSDAVDAHLDTMEEQGDGTRFVLTGHLTSGQYKGWPFRAL